LGAFSAGRRARTDRRQIEDTTAFEPPGRGNGRCGIRVGTQIPAVEDEKPAVEREVLACQAAQWQASLVQSLDQACAFEVVVGEFPAATVAVGLEKACVYLSLKFRPSESGEFAKFGRLHRKSHRTTPRFASEGVVRSG